MPAENSRCFAIAVRTRTRLLPMLSNVAYALVRAVSRLFSTPAFPPEGPGVEKSLDTARTSAYATLLLKRLSRPRRRRCGKALHELQSPDPGHRAPSRSR